jgi:hypothetical protein
MTILYCRYNGNRRKNMILVVNGINQADAFEMTFKEFLSNIPAGNAIWFTNEEISFNVI